jgi:nucleotidyltransferase substrate binding protein (TIGR01987 family)
MSHRREINKKFVASVEALETAIKFKSKALEEKFYFYGIAKAFEVCFEYTWKHMRQYVVEEGLDAASPRDAIKQAANLELIDNLDRWLDYLRDRNLAVHDHFHR